MDWIEDIKKEVEQKTESEKFLETNLYSIYENFTEIADAEVDKINAELFNGESVCNIKSDYKTRSFEIVIGNFSEIKMKVTFTQEKFIKVLRELKTGKESYKSLPEIIAIRFHSGSYIITYEPELIDGQLNTKEIGQETLAKLLVEPVVRKYFDLPQKSYQKNFGR